MSDGIETLISDATGGDAEDDAADAILSPEQLAEIRNSGQGKAPPKVTRPAEPGDDDKDDGEPEPEPAPRPRSRGKFAGYRKHEVEAEAERLAQRVEELEREKEQEKEKAPDPNVLRDLAFTVEFATRIGFGSAAMIRGPHWRITDEEVERIKDTGVIALGPMAAEYANMLPWINLAAALGVPIATRIAEDRRIAKLQEFPPDAT